MIDENLPPRLARSLAALFDGIHEVIHLRDRFGERVTDETWIADLSAEGLWVIISGDRRISRNRSEQHVFRSSNLIGFFLSKGLYKAQFVKQMERIMAMWPSIEKQADLVAGGAMFEIPMTSTRLKQL